MPDEEIDKRVRLDRWLWAARFFKTRSLAATAIDSGKVQVNDTRVKRSKLLRIGDELKVRKGPYEFVLTVRALAERRGPAVEAQTLYEESEDSKEARERINEARRLQREAALPPVRAPGKGRPTKRDRRALARFRRGTAKKPSEGD
ncbi:MAG: RNA-binding S4 domain-containing protein [Proteobacteria bacterium]|nr:RNA-binding S4 domain-containing protein [Pseudomonadota bacterium]